MINHEQWLEWYYQYRGVARCVFSWLHDKNAMEENSDYATHLAIGTYDENRHAGLSTHVWLTARGLSTRLRRQMLHEKDFTQYTETPDENGFSPMPPAKSISHVDLADARHDLVFMDKYLLEQEQLRGTNARKAGDIIREHVIENKSFREIGMTYGTSNRATCKIYLNAMDYIQLRYSTTEKINEAKRKVAKKQVPKLET
jgi:hypothetical protein